MNNIDILKKASGLLFIAAMISLIMGICMTVLPDGREAVSAIGGVMDAAVPLKTAQIVLFLDTLFPLAFGPGLIAFAYGFENDGNKAIIRIILLAMLIAVISDFVENALAYKAMTEQGKTALQWPMTVVKYASIALAGILLSLLFDSKTRLSYFVISILRYLVPVFMALLISGFAGEFGRVLVGTSFPCVLLILSYYAKCKTSAD